MDSVIKKLLKDCKIEHKTLGEVCNITIGEFINKNNQSKDYKFKVFNGGVTHTGYYNKYNNEANKIIISARGSAGFVNLIKEPFWAGNSCYSISIKNPENLNLFFIYYILKNKQNELIKLKNNGSIPSISKKQVEQIIISFPPISVQNEIVKILDKFTQSKDNIISNLQKELKNHNNQYKYYRDKLLTFDDSVEWKNLGDVFNIITGGDVPKKSFSVKKTEEYCVPIISNGIEENSLYGYTNIAKINIPSLTISARGTIGWTNLQEKPFFPIVRLIVLTPKIELNLKYTYYFMKTIEKSYKVQSSGIPQLTKPMIKDIKIPVPSIAEQESIVTILDKFTLLNQQINIKIQREIDLTQNQYEYYRNKLLSFK